MKKNLTEIVFILDRSGSMAGLEGDTIGGFNAMIEKQKAEPGEAIVSTVLFDNYSEVLHDRLDIQKIRPMTREEYFATSSFSHRYKPEMIGLVKALLDRPEADEAALEQIQKMVSDRLQEVKASK